MKVTKKQPKPKGTQKSADSKAVQEPTSFHTEFSGSRRQNDEQDQDELSEILTEKPKAQGYPHLAHRIRNIPQEIVTSKWSPPSQQVQDQVREIFTYAMRSVIPTRRDERRGTEAEILLRQVVRKLERRVSRMLLPPNAKGMHFDLNQLLERNRILESHLTPATHANELLKKEIKRAELELADEKRNLAELETNLKSARLEQKKQDRPHPLLRLPKNFKIQGDGPEDIGLRPSTGTDMSVFDNFENPDPDLGHILEQLRRSLESMQANHDQVQGIDEAIKYAKVALDDVLFNHASSEQYDSL
ncbi:hypothetical protein GQ43DRAFT_376891 [Delitschia confertaspora ATCC 74209]|uniref:CENP-Q, a CENPA-CAD centromere complex subunit-domain-containing protein n=1 Tax=Delitschia confertaspora ATCC 74209 TaxID=1513339 RepID=A0A9P4JMG4_9PLEO|nr:hypothetical protein GQ43DRAFT_376891 [Delitschia confertaspora ATCC 74209]